MSNEQIYNQWTNFINDPNYIKYFQSNEEIWLELFEQVKLYINKNNKRPSISNKDIKIKQLGSWISDQQKNYKKKKKIMSNEQIYNQWTKFINDPNYIKYFQSNNNISKLRKKYIE